MEWSTVRDIVQIVSDQFRLGIGLKLINGLIHFETEKCPIFNWASDPDDAYAITGQSDIVFRRAGLGDHLFGNPNIGFGLDFGF